jgi:hypothetical protein
MDWSRKAILRDFVKQKLFPYLHGNGFCVSRRFLPTVIQSL